MLTSVSAFTNTLAYNLTMFCTNTACMCPGRAVTFGLSSASKQGLASVKYLIHAWTNNYSIRQKQLSDFCNSFHQKSTSGQHSFCTDMSGHFRTTQTLFQTTDNYRTTVTTQGDTENITNSENSPTIQAAAYNTSHIPFFCTLPVNKWLFSSMLALVKNTHN